MAFPLSKTKNEFKEKNLYLWFLFFVMLFPPTLIPTFLTVRSLGLMNSLWALVLPGAVPVWNIIILTSYYRTIPKELEEAAYVDGASVWYVLLRIYIPLSIPAIATVTLFSIVGHWNDFFSGLIYITNTRLLPLQTYIQQMSVRVDFTTMTAEEIRIYTQMSQRTLNAAKVVVAMVPVLMIYPFIQKYFVTGITLGSVKE